MIIFFIIYLITILLLFVYSIWRNNHDNDLQVLQVGYLIALMEALCQKNGISIAEVKMVAFDKECTED